MTYRIGWLSPLTPASGIGTFTHAVTRQFPRQFDGRAIDLTILYVGHDTIYGSEHRAIRIGEDQSFHDILSLFDLLVYNIGNNREHHEPIFALLRLHPGIVICHDFVYQNYLADRAQRRGGSFSSLAALLVAFGGDAASCHLRRSRFTSRLGRARYQPWGSAASVDQPMSEAILALGSALVVHSSFAQRHAERSHSGPVVRLGMPHDQKDLNDAVASPHWAASIATKARFELVSFGHIQATKCIDLVIAALGSSAMLRRRLRYTVAGFVCNASYFDHLKAMVTDLSLHDCVAFELEVSEARLVDLMQTADIFSNLRRPNTEGASVSLIEQLATGKPVLVIDSGCYADIPSEAAVKLPPDVTSSRIGATLERLIAEPASMPAIGEAGRAFAQTWSCAAYAEALLRFAHIHRETLQDRGRFVATRRTPSNSARPDAWLRSLARARRSLTYLDRDMLMVDPELVLTRTHSEICTYVAQVIFGVFDDAPLDRALSRFFVRLDRPARYWACVRLALLADAAFGEDETARRRIVNLRPCYEVEFWSVIAALPGRQCLTAAALLLLKRPPIDGELSTAGLDDEDNFPKRLRIASLIDSMEPAPASPLEQLGRWLGASAMPGPEPEFTTSAAGFEASVGGARFRQRVDLSGFYPMEQSRAWTRGKQGFIGLRLDEPRAVVEVLVHHICASAERPASIVLSHQNIETRVEANDGIPRWLSIAPTPAGEDILWLQLATDVTAVPGASADTRLLGLCLLAIRIRAPQADPPSARFDGVGPQIAVGGDHLSQAVAAARD